MTSMTSPDTAQTEILPSPRLTLRWALKRAVLAILIIVVGIGVMAWLMHSATKSEAKKPAAETTAIAVRANQ